MRIRAAVSHGPHLIEINSPGENQVYDAHLPLAFRKEADPMQSFPHLYRVSAESGVAGIVDVSSPQLPSLETMAPPEFGGDPGYWSPETLLVAAVADCLILSFRAVARASRLEWHSLHCDVDGKLERSGGLTLFSHFDLRARLEIRHPDDRDKARLCLEKAKQACLITNSLKAETSLHQEIDVVESA